MAKKKAANKEAERDEGTNKKVLKGLHWRVNPSAFLKKMKVEATLPKKDRLDLTELVKLPKGVTLLYHPEDGLTIFGNSKASLAEAIKFVLKFHADHGIGYFTKEGKPRIFGHSCLSESVMEKAGFLLSDEVVDEISFTDTCWVYPGPDEAGASEEDTPKKAKKANNVAQDKEETNEKKASKKDQPKKGEKKSLKTTSLKRDPAALAELLEAAAMEALADDEWGIGFNIPTAVAFELHGYKRLNTAYYDDLIRSLEEYGLGIIFGEAYWTLIFFKGIPQLSSLRKNDFNRAIKALQKATLS